MEKVASGAPERSGRVDTATFLFHLLVVLSRHRDAHLDKALKPLGLNVSRHRALSVIAGFEPCTMSELSEFSCVDRTTMTRTVDQLVAAGLVERGASPTDRRRVLLSLTARARALHEQALSVIAKVGDKVLEGVPEDARRAFVRAERTMIRNIIGDDAAAERVISLRRPEPARA